MPHRQASLSSSISEDDYTEYILRSSHPVIRVTGVETDPEMIARRTRETFEVTYRQHEDVAYKTFELARKVDDINTTLKTLSDTMKDLQTLMLNKFSSIEFVMESRFSAVDGSIRSLNAEMSGLRKDTGMLQYTVEEMQTRLDTPNTMAPPNLSSASSSKSIEFARPPRNSDSLDSLPKVNIEPVDDAPGSSTAPTTTSTIPLRTTKSSNSMRRIASLLRGVLGTAEKLADEDERRLPTNSL